MTESDQAIIARLSSDVAVIGAYLARASADLGQLQRIVATRAAQPHHQPPMPTPRPVPWQPPPARPSVTPRSEGWIGKVLAVAGVAVTLVGVALLLVLAAQAGILRPEVRVAAGAALAVGLVYAARRLHGRPGGRVGAIALAATGIAAGYIDVIAVTAIYGWAPPAIGLGLAALVAAAGLLLARRWDSEHLGLLVVVPLIALAPLVADGFTPLLVGFMLALSAASVPVQSGRDWIGMHAARTAASTLPLLAAMALENSPALAVAAATAAALAIGSALILLASTKNAGTMAALSALGTLPVLAASTVVDGIVAALMGSMLAALLLGIVLVGDRLPMVTAPVRTVWSVLAAVSALVAVTAAFDAPVAGPVLLAMAVVLGVAGRDSKVARWCAVGFGVGGGMFHLVEASPFTLVSASVLSTPTALSILISSFLVVALAVMVARSWPSDWSWPVAALLALYGITMFAVTAGVLIGGANQGFFAGHVVATIGWVALAGGVLRDAARAPRARRSLAVGGGMTVVAAAMAKLFLFDLGTLDGIFRVVVFIVVGLALLGMGAGYARLLAQSSESDQAPTT